MKIGMISLGCPKNLVDSEVMLGLAADAGHELTREAADADVLVVNTCAFIDRAKRESIDAILEMAQHKKQGRCRRLIVAGCLAERYRDELRAEIPEIDALIGTGEVPQILEAIGAAPSERRTASAGNRFVPLLRATGQPVTLPGRANGTSTEPSNLRTGNLQTGNLQTGNLQTGNSRTGEPEPENLRTREPENPPSRLRPSVPHRGYGEARASARQARRVRPTYIYDATTPRLLATPKHYAYVKIAEGCDYKCAFCIIPSLRGAYRSRPAASIVAEAQALAARGVKELLLVSQDTTFYGIDRGERGALARLLRELDAVDGLEWIRLLYLYPTTIGDDVLDVMADSRRICRYIDLPLQHASDAVLRRMRRPGTRASYERLVERIRRRVPGVTLRTTFIVGFPGESDEDFERLERFVREVGFDHVGVFTYSHEEGTTAYALADDVPGSVKRRRRAQLMSLQRRLARQAQRARIGTQIRVLVDGPSAEHDLVLRGRTEGQAPDIDPCVYLTEADPSLLGAGDFVTAEVVATRDYDLIAKPV